MPKQEMCYSVTVDTVCQEAIPVDQQLMNKDMLITGKEKCITKFTYYFMVALAVEIKYFLLILKEILFGRARKLTLMRLHMTSLPLQNSQ